MRQRLVDLTRSPRRQLDQHFFNGTRGTTILKLVLNAIFHIPFTAERLWSSQLLVKPFQPGLPSRAFLCVPKVGRRLETGDNPRC